MLFGKKKKTREERLDQKYLFYKEIVYLLTRAFYTSTLKWWEMLIVVVCGVFLGLGIGLLAGGYLYPKPPRTIIIPLNETHIIRVG